MASVHREPNGRWKVQFMPAEPGRKRQALRLGRVSKREAEEVKGHVERILESRKAGLALEERSEKWLAKLTDRLRQRLIETGVIEDGGRRARSSLSGFFDDYIHARTDITAGTRTLLRNASKWLEAYFGATREMDSITPGEAELFRAWLGSTGGLAENTIRGVCRKARQFFRSAYRQRLIRENPFAGMKRLMDLPSPPSRQFYATRSLTEQVLKACPDDEWRLIFALARYGGLRCPTELAPLKWSDIDWKKGQFVVTCIKTKRHQGRELRTVPLFPELRPFLETCYRAKDRHPTKVIKRVKCDKNNLRTQMTRILERAGIKVWPKLFQNLRSTRESELINQHGPALASRWMGNTVPVAMRNYFQITDEDFDRANGSESDRQAS